MPTSHRPRVRVAIANDFDLVVLGLAAALESYSDRIEIVELDSTLTPVSEVDVVLYDAFAHSVGSPPAIEALTQGGLARVVIFSWRGDAKSVELSRRPAVAGFIEKELPVAQIVARIEAVGRGERLPAPDLIPTDLAPAFEGAWPGQTEGLSERESETLALIVSGLSNREVAEQAFVTINTVKTHIRTAYQKMGVVRRSQAVLWGMEHGFVPDRSRVVVDS